MVRKSIWLGWLNRTDQTRRQDGYKPSLQHTINQVDYTSSIQKSHVEVYLCCGRKESNGVQFTRQSYDEFGENDHYLFF